jgi:archaellum biogenesis ATPase FlaH
MKRKKINTEAERKIIIGLIVSDSFCLNCLPLVKPEYFKLEYAKPILKWVSEYYEKYEIAPGLDMYDLFRKNQKTVSKPLVEIIEIFLSKVSQEYETTVFNTQFQIDLAKRYFKDQAMILRCNKISKLIENGKGEEAEKIDSTPVITVDSGLSDVYNPFDEKEIKDFFLEQDDGLFSFKGVLGELVGKFDRNNMVIITGPEKRGKTWWLQELAFEALSQKLKVLWFPFEMNKNQTKTRLYAQLTAMQRKPSKNIIYPVFDCKYNQTGECNSPKRTNRINNLLSGVGENEFPIYKNFPSYKACTVCRGTSEFKTAVWYENQEIVKELNAKNLKNKIKGYKQLFGNSNLRIVNFPSFTASFKEMEQKLKQLITEGFVPDVIIDDYLDIHKKEQASSEREAILNNWQQSKRLTSQYNVVYISGDQADSKARKQKSLNQDNFTDDKRKDGILEMRLGLNQTVSEKERGIMRVNILYNRMNDFSIKKEVMVLQCLALGQPYLDSEWI